LIEYNFDQYQTEWTFCRYPRRLEFLASHVDKAVGYEATTIGNGTQGFRSNI